MSYQANQPGTELTTEELLAISQLAELGDPNQVLSVTDDGLGLEYTDRQDLSGYELLENKSTDTSLGTSDILYPTQKAVKSYIGNSLGDYLKLDQTTEQQVINGMPDFNGGLKVSILGGEQYYGTNSPVIYDGIDRYIANDGEGDNGLTCLWYISENETLLFLDDGESGDRGLLTNLNGTDTPTINIHICGANFGDETEPYWIYFTGYSDLGGDDFADIVNTLLGTGDMIVTLHSEVAFTYNEETGNYDLVTELVVCDSTDYTDFITPPTIQTVSGGFVVNPNTSNISHIGNYTNTNKDSVYRSYGEVQLGNGDLIGAVPTPFISNFKVETPNSLSNDPAFGAISMVQLQYAEDTISNCFAAGLYGATYVGGTDVTYQGQAVGLWFSLALTGEDCSLKDGYGIKTGVAANGGSVHIDDFTSVLSEATNLTGGDHTITNLIHFGNSTIANSFTVTNNYGLKLVNNSERATNSWGVYSEENNNLMRRLFLGSTVTKPTETLEIQGNAKISDGILMKSPDGTSYKITVANGGTLTVTAV